MSATIGAVAGKWLERALGRLKRDDEANARRIGELFYRRSLYADEPAFFAALLAEFPPGAPLGGAALARLVEGLRRDQAGGAELEAQIDFWSQLAERSGSAYAAGCHADALLSAGRAAEALPIFLGALEREPALLPELGDEFETLARSEGGALWLRYRIATLGALLAEAIASGDDDGDAVREMYSDLLDEFRDDPGAIERVRAVGAELERAVARGQLPRAMVRRGRPRD